MSFGPLPDFPVSPIMVRKTARYNRNGAHTNVYPYISTPVCGIPLAVRKGGTILSGSSASKLGLDRRSAGSSRGQGQGPVLGAEKISTATSSGRGSVKERTTSSGGRTLSKSSPEARSGSKTSGEKSSSKGRSTESKVGENVETNAESLKRPVDSENSKSVPKQPKLAARRPGKSILQPVQNMGHNKQTNAVESSGERERGQKSSQSSNPSNGKPSTDSRRLRRERKASTSTSAASNNLRASRASSVAVSKSNKTQDFNSKAAGSDSATKSSDTAASSRISGAESALCVKAVEPNASGRRFFKSPIKPHLVTRADKKLNKGSKTRGSNQQVSTAKRQDQKDSIYDLNSSSESSQQIANRQHSLGALRKRRIEESAARGLTLDDVGDGRQGHWAKRRRTRDSQLNSTDVGSSGPDLSRDVEPLRFEIRVKPKVYSRWKNVSEPLRDYISVTSDRVFMELLKNTGETSVPEAVKCVEELKTRIFDRIDRIKVPTSKVSTDYFNLIDQQSYLQSEVSETQDNIEHLQKLIEKTRQEIATLSGEQLLPSND